jgi:hypothetical protein
MDLMSMRMTAVLLLLLTLSIPAFAAAPPAGQASGDLAVNGKRLALKYAVAITGPDSFEPTQEAVIVLLTPAPVPQSKIDAATSFSNVRSIVDTGIAFRFRVGEGFHITIRHDVLDGKELQTSGPASALKDIVVGPDSVSGSIAPWMGSEENIMDFVVKYSIHFTAAIARRFPVDKPVVFTAAAKTLTAGGGAPGKAFLDEKCKPVPTDVKGVEAALKEAGALPTDNDLKELSKSAGHEVTRAEFIQQMLDMSKGMAASRHRLQSVGRQSRGRRGRAAGSGEDDGIRQPHGRNHGARRNAVESEERGHVESGPIKIVD